MLKLVPKNTENLKSTEDVERWTVEKNPIQPITDAFCLKRVLTETCWVFEEFRVFVGEIVDGPTYPTIWLKYRL